MGHCFSKKTTSLAVNDAIEAPTPASVQTTPFPSPLPAGISPSPARTPGRRIMKWPFPPPSPAKPIMAAFRRRRKECGGITPERTVEQERERGLDKNFGYSKNFGAKYELGEEVGRGHFGHTCWAKGKKGDVKGVSVAVKIISKSKMNSAVAIEDVRREVKMLKALSGNPHMLKFYDAFEDANTVYLVMELCEGAELLDRILQRGGRYVEEDSKGIVVQILSAVAFCHLQGVVHRDLKPENFLFATKDDDSCLKVIDFGLSDYVRPDQWLNDVVGSAFYVAPEVLHGSYNTEADMWSIGVITYILLCGSRPFYAKTESATFCSVLRANPNFEDIPWPNISAEGKNFVKRLLNKDPRKRMTAAQALAHPWLRDENRSPLPLDILPIKLVRSYVRATPLKRAALKALSKALTDNELFYLKAQFRLLEPKDGCVSLENFKAALAKNATDAMKDARIPDFFTIKIDFEEFCAAVISVYQLEALQDWDRIATVAFQYFEQEGNRRISVEHFARELNLGPTAHALVKDWIRSSDGNINFMGYTNFLHGVTIRGFNTRRQ
ncbi:CDPK-related kinase 6-like isoform X1 [Chenopodium quinoa]|uniref:CDPK-related kinase 6-like isoform X1 n=1 Tax=Chenopodium quinoa TaxID=63459 RepID=UPI000B77D7CD|nr:CDPK-related kinase 6-like isoform X1 [Chenopodium quinoa]